MAVRPILFSAPMVRALLEGRKTQTRRLHEHNLRARIKLGATPNKRESKYAIGDLLWARETWRLTHVGGGRGGDIVPFNAYELERRADGSREYFEVVGDDDPYLKQANDKWRPSIYMPRWASRLTLEITGVRVQRLQDISEEDADAEGFGGDFPSAALPEVFPGNAEAWSHLSMAECYGRLWDHINGAGSWDANPWVIALSFAVHKMNVDAFLARRAERTKETA